MDLLDPNSRAGVSALMPPFTRYVNHYILTINTPRTITLPTEAECFVIKSPTGSVYYVVADGGVYLGGIY